MVGQNARSYVVGAFLVCASTLALVVGIQSGRRLAWAAYVVLSALAVYTVVLTALVLVAQLGSLLLLPRRAVEGRLLGVSASAMALLMVPLVWVFADHGTGPAQWASAPGAVLGKNNRYLFEFLASARSVGVPFNQSIVDCVVIGMVLSWSLAACRFLVGLARSRRTPESWGLGLLLAWFVFPTLATYLISVWIQPVLSDRYILAALPPASMLAGVLVSWLRPWPVAVATGLALLVLRAWLIMPGYGVPLENWRQGVLEVTAKSQPKDCIAFFVSDGYTAFDYYVEHLKSLPGPTPKPVLPASSWQSRTPYALDPQPIPAARMPEVVASCPRLWLVDSHAAGALPGPGIPGYRVSVYQADHALLTELDASYRETSAWWFRGAHVFLYVRDP